MNMKPMLALTLCVLFLACNGNEMAGGNAKMPSRGSQTSDINSKDFGAGDGGAGTKNGPGNEGGVGSNGSTASNSNNGSSSTNGSNSNTGNGTTSSSDPIIPDSTVDGMEVIKDCNNCMARAKQLSQQLGFVADKNMALNLGYYKIPPDQGLCDIHFMSKANLPIADHEGKDSLLGDQVALYCPCNCGWTEPDPYH